MRRRAVAVLLIPVMLLGGWGLPGGRIVGAEFVRADVDGDGKVSLADAVHILRALFARGTLGCEDAADVNDSGRINLADVISLLLSLFMGWAVPPPSACGDDPSEDSLGCDSFAPCAAPQPAYDLGFSTFLGGSGGENFRDVAVDSQGNIYVTGGTSSADFPTTPGAYDRTFATGGADLGTFGPMDVFVTKLSPAGAVIWSTYIGGPNYDRAYGIEVGADGCAFVAGRAGPGFPTTPGALQEGFGGDGTAGPSSAYGKQDGFVAKLAPDGSRLLWATYFGGNDSGFLRDLDIDSQGNVYVIAAGNVDPGNPHVTLGAYDTTHNGAEDVIVAKIDPDGTRVIWGTYLGGSANDSGGPSIRVHEATGEVCAVGNTSSANFPTPGGYDRSYGGGAAQTGDAFLVKLTPDGSGVVFGTFLGGSGDEGTGTHNLVIDSRGNPIVGHWTRSAGIPILPGGFRTTHSGDVDCIIWKFSPSGSLLANTYLGGSGGENIQGIVADGQGNIYVSVDASTSTDLPVTQDAFQGSNRGGSDGAFFKLSPDLSRVIYGTYLGGSGSDGSREAALGPDGSYVSAGDTKSSDFPLRNAQDQTLGGSVDGFVARFTPR